jgi:hypothetical protein
VHPLATMTIHTRSSGLDGHDMYEGEAVMSQEQKDRYKALIGDGLAKITVARDIGEKDFGSGGSVAVTVTLTCDQSEGSVGNAIALANDIANYYAWHYHSQLKQQLLNAGILGK